MIVLSDNYLEKLRAIVLAVLTICVSIIFYSRVNKIKIITKINGKNDWLASSLPLAPMAVCVGFYPEFCVLLVGMVSTPLDVIYFSSAFRVAFLIAFILAAVDSVSLPKISQLYSLGDLKQLESYVRRATLIKTIAATAGVFFLFFFGDWVLSWFGAEFKLARNTLIVLGSSLFIRSILGPSLEVLSVTGHQNECLWVCLGYLLATGLAIGVITPYFGFFGASVAVNIITLIISLWTRSIVRRRIGINPDLLSKPIH